MKHLYNPKDVAEVRVRLFSEQNGRDEVTGLGLDYKDAVLDHNHETQFVRAVLHRQVNAALGKIENIWKRYLSTWYPNDLSTFLNQVAHYLNRPDDKRFVHPKWLNKCKTEFNKLTSSQQVLMLNKFNVGDVSSIKNNVSRKAAFNTLLLTRGYTFDIIMNRIKEVKHETNRCG